MPDLVDAIKNYVKSPKKHFDTDEVDQLNFFITPLLLFVGCLLIALKQYFGTPIQCWVPAEFTNTFEQYTEAFCFSQNTYFVKSGAPLPEIESRKAGEIDYYQWVPLFLFLQGSLFYIPHAIWSFLNNKNGTPLESIVKMSVDLSVAMDVDSKELETVAEHIYTGITQHKELKKKDSLSSFVHRSRYLVTCYLFTKGLYLLQILVQYYLMHTIIGTKSNFWGYEFAKNFFEGKDWEETGHFPRETMCDFSVRYPGTHRRVTVQCVLIVNMINEKLYLFLWFYLIFVFVATALNILSWAWVLFFSSCRLNFVQSTMLECADWDNFVEKFLKIDGVFVMMLINKNAGSLTTHDIFQALWKIYAKEKANKEKVVEKNPKEDGAFNGDVPGAEA